MTQVLALLAALLAAGFLFLAWRNRQTPRTGSRDLLPLVAALIVGVVALFIENADTGNFTVTEYVLLAVSVVLLVVGGVLAARERRSLAQGRANWGVVVGGLLLILTVAFPVLAARLALDDEIDTLEAPTAGPTESMSNVARGVYDRVLAVISEETGYDTDTISERLDAGDASVADMVREVDGDMEAVIQGITAVMQDEIRSLAAADRMDDGTAALAISSMETAVRIGVEVDLTGLMARFEPDDQEDDQAAAQ